MKTKAFSLIILAILMVIGIGGCSNDKDIDPDKYSTSLLTGDYGKGKIWDLKVSVNDQPIEDYGYVRFESKKLEKADFRFVKVIPGVSDKKFNNIPLTETEKGLTFTIEDNSNSTPVEITGVVVYGVMTVNVRM